MASMEPECEANIALDDDKPVDLRALASWVHSSFLQEEEADDDGPPAIFRASSSDSVLASSRLSSSSSSYSPDEASLRLSLADDLDGLVDDLPAFEPPVKSAQATATKVAWSAEEDKAISEAVALHGHKWSRIRNMLPKTSCV